MKMITFKEFLEEENKPVLVGVEWVSKDGIRYSAREDGYVDCKVSDWDNAVKSELSGRKIVHIYLVKDESGKIKPYGKQSAMKVLGVGNSFSSMSKQVFDKKANKFLKELEAKKYQINCEMEEVKGRISDSAKEIKERSAKCVFGGRYTYSNNILLVKKGNDFSFAIYDDKNKFTKEEIESRLEADGWDILTLKELKTYIS